MTYDRNSFEYQMNQAAFHEMDNFVPMTKPERDALKRWVKEGNDLAVNPWDYLDSEGLPIGYLQAYRLKFGYHHGPWTTGKDLILSSFGMKHATVLSLRRISAN